MYDMCQDLNEKQLRNEELLKSNRSLLYELMEVSNAKLFLHYFLCTRIFAAASSAIRGHCEVNLADLCYEAVVIRHMILQ